MAMVSRETDQRERVDVVEGAKPASANIDTTEAHEEPAAPRSLKQRLADIRDECAGIGKEDIKMEKDGKKWTIKGHTVEAILSEVRPLLSKHGVDLEPTLVERAYSGNRCDVIVDFTFERTDDSDEKRVIRWAGAGTDNGDKAFAKAGTNALKEVLKKRFLITDRDDAKEEEEQVEHQTEEGINRAEMERQAEAKRAALELWAKALRNALKTAKTLEEVRALELDNKEQLRSRDTPAATREFFIDLIQQRKKEFEGGQGGGVAEEAPSDVD
jgi:hypothetical protein